MLTRKQYELLVYIDKHLKATGFSPSFEEMKDALRLRSKSGIHRLISALEERGYLGRRHHRARALEVLRLPDNMTARAAIAAEPEVEAEAVGAAAIGADAVAAADEVTPSFKPNVIRGDFTGRLQGARAASDAAAVQLPLYGRIAAGLPIEALRDNTNSVDVPMSMLGSGEHFALEVAGDSMVDAGILDGDTVLIRRAETADNGDIVVALVDDNVVTLKKFRIRNKSIALEPCNSLYEPQILPADKVKVQGKLVGLIRKY
jgi:repressor LexA